MIMEKQTKRKVLSLSLSQPGKQRKKTSRLKQHASSATENLDLSVTNSLLQASDLRSNSDENLSRLDPSACSNHLLSSAMHSPPLKCNLNDDFSVSQELVQDNAVKSSVLFGSSFNKMERKKFSKDIQSDHERKKCSIPEDTLSNENQTFKRISLSHTEKVASPQTEVVVKKGKDEDITSTTEKVSVDSIFSEHTMKADEVKLVNSTSKCKQDVTEHIGKKGASDCSKKMSGNPQLAFDSKLDLATESNTLLASGPNNTDHKKSVSSFASEENGLEILQCPMCFKTFDKLSTKTAHLKGCASKHKMTTQQLLEAVELQQRQAAERKALGLPGIPSTRGNVKKPSGSKRESRSVPQMDSGLQLAMALSLSLQDQQAVENSLRGEGSKVASLEHFGFVGKPSLDAIRPHAITSTVRGRDKNVCKRTPTLLSRTAEERDRIITEKVAMVLLEGSDLESNSTQPEVRLHSTFLQQCVDKENLLWTKTNISPTKANRSSYYVDTLRGFISPSKVEMGSKIMHLSQVPGRVKTPTKVTKQIEDVEEALASPSDGENSSDSCDIKSNEFMNPSHIEMELRAKLFNDWAEMVNNSSMSDLAIYPQEGREIPTHKIILQVRCPLILRDISKQRNILTGNEVEVIMWTKTPHSAALAFLEYVYCGSVKSIRALSKDLTSMFWLANHYKITDLLRYLKAVSANPFDCETSSQMALKSVHEIDGSTAVVHYNQESRENKIIHDISSNLESKSATSCVRKLRRNSDNLFESPPRQSETESISSEVTLPGTSNRSLCSSPDMFCDEEMEREPNATSEGRNDSDNVVNSSHSLSTNSRVLYSVSKTTEENDEQCNRSPSECASISSDKTVVLVRNTPPPSPAPSNASAVTEVLDFNPNELRKSNVDLNDSKRKLSGSSLGEDSEYCKRLRSISPNKHKQQSTEDVEVFDLTQDSDSNSSFPAITQNFSGETLEKPSVSSGVEIVNNDDKNYSVSSNRLSDHKSVEKTNIPHTSNCTVTSPLMGERKPSNDYEEIIDTKSPEHVPEPYISPVWDGFEELNYDDPYFLPPSSKGESPERRKTSQTHEPTLERSISNANHEEIAVQSTSTNLNEDCSKTQRSKLQTRERESMSSSDREVSPQKPSEKSKTSDYFGDLLDDSLDVNSSVLQRAESEMQETLTQRGTKGTPVNRVISENTDSITPLANYSAMKTPELKRELQKFGLKPSLGKRKGKIMLRHIYNELHPWVPAKHDQSLKERDTLSQPTTSNRTEKHPLSLSQPLNTRKLFPAMSDSDSAECDAESADNELEKNELNSDDSLSSGSTSLQEVQFLEDDNDNFEPLSQASSQFVSVANLPTVVYNFIMNNTKLHRKVLEYEPIWIEQLQNDLRSNGFKLKMQDLMAFLDEKCITFRTAQSGPRVKKRKQRSSKPKKKTGKGSDTNEQSD